MKTWMRGILGLTERLGVDVAVSDPMQKAIELWMSMYQGRAPWLCEDVVSLNLPAFVASEVARMATVEMKCELSGSRGEYLRPFFQRVVDDARLFTEYAAAGGSIALKPYVAGKGPAVDYVQAGRFFPTVFNASGDVTGCLFVDTIVRGDALFTRVEQHEMEPGGCRITNRAFETKVGGDELGEPIELAAVDEWAELSPEAFISGIDRPLFAILKMPYANTIDPGSPIGISSYARAVNLIREADNQFSRLLWEMESGNRAMYVDMRAFSADDADPGVLPFKRFYRMMDVDPTVQGELFREWSPALRVNEQLTALNEILQKIEDACGLSRGTLSEAPESGAAGAKTATELKIMRQRTFATIRDTQKAVEVALRQLLYAMDVWCTIANLTPLGDYEVSFEFDDSIVSDRSTEFLERLQLVQLGVMNEWELRAWYTGETEATAKANLPSKPELASFPEAE